MARPLAAGAVILRRFAFNAAEQLSAILMMLPASRRFARWSLQGIYHVGGDDQLWASGLDDPSQGYLYSPIDPQTNKPWPAMPKAFMIYVNVRLRRRAIQISTRCLSYQPLRSWRETVAASGKDEPDLRAPIVSVSLGLPAIFNLAA